MAIAWADGHISSGETEWIDQVFEQLQVPPFERNAMLDGPQGLPSEEELHRVLKTHEERLDLVRILLTLSLSDGTTSADELSMLSDLGRRLGVSPAELEDLRQHTLA